MAALHAIDFSFFDKIQFDKQRFISWWILWDDWKSFFFIIIIKWIFFPLAYIFFLRHWLLILIDRLGDNVSNDKNQSKSFFYYVIWTKKKKSEIKSKLSDGFKNQVKTTQYDCIGSLWENADNRMRSLRRRRKKCIHHRHTARIHQYFTLLSHHLHFSNHIVSALLLIHMCVYKLIFFVQIKI